MIVPRLTRSPCAGWLWSRIASCMSSNGHVSPMHTAFLFPGQGAQFVGMSNRMYEDVPNSKLLFDQASQILGYDLYEMCCHGDKQDLDSTRVSQPAIFVNSMVAIEKLRLVCPEAIETCDVAAGLSLGEYSALCFAGAFTFEDGVRLTKARGEAMQAASDAAPTAMMAALGSTRPKIEELCSVSAERSGTLLSIGNYLCEGNYVITGHRDACTVAKEISRKYGAKLIPLAVSGAFHSPYMASAVPPLRDTISTISFTTPRLPVISNVDACSTVDPEKIKSSLLQQVTHPVLWEESMMAVLSSKIVRTLYEVGPGNVCSNIAKKINKAVNVQHIS